MKIKTVSHFVPEALLAALSPAVLEETLAAIMDGTRAFWIAQASVLTSSRREYIDGIQPVHQEGLHASIDLVGVLPNLVEQGQEPYDMRKTLLVPGAKGVKTGADGKRYRSVPFRHQTPGTAGLGGGAPMGDPYKGVVENSAAMGREIYKAAKALPPGKGLPEGYAPKLKAVHATDIYAGMLKVQSKGKSQVYYRTFRTISENSPPEVWLHPGIEAHNFVNPVADYVDKVAQQAFDALIKTVGLT